MNHPEAEGDEDDERERHMENIGVAIVSQATLRDQLALGRLVIVAMRDFAITRPLWRLRAPAPVETPAVKASSKLLRMTLPLPPTTHARLSREPTRIEPGADQVGT